MNIFKKKMSLIADLFPKLRIPKNVVRSISKKSRFRGSFENQHGKRAQTLLKFERQPLYHIYWGMWRQLTYKESVLVICKILRLFSNTLSADGKYSLLNKDNLMQPIQMQLYWKENPFSPFFFCIWNIFKKRMILIADVFPKLRTQKNIVRSMPKKTFFKGSFEKQHGKCAQTFFKCQGRLLYHIHGWLWRQVSNKKSLLVICKISRLFPNTLSADGKYPLFNRDKITEPI